MIDPTTAQPAAPQGEATAPTQPAAPRVRYTRMPDHVFAAFMARAGLQAPGTAAAHPGTPQAPSEPRAPGAPSASAALTQPSDSPGQPQPGANAPPDDNTPPAPAGEIEAVAARVDVTGALQTPDGEMPGLDPAVAREYGRMLEEGLRNPPSRAQKLQGLEQCRRALEHAYPNGKAAQIIEDARAELAKVAARIPELPQWLEQTGRGNDVGIIVRLAQRHAQRAGARLAKAARQ